MLVCKCEADNLNVTAEKLETMDIEGLEIVYREACQRHTVVLCQAVCAAIFKMKCQRACQNQIVFDVVLDHMTQGDALAVADILVKARMSQVDAIDVVYSSTEKSLDGLIVLRLLHAAGCKLRTVDLRDMSLGNAALRVLFQGGLHCQSLDLSFARLRKLEMLGHFPALHTLRLDYSFPINNLPERCFQAMPKLARLSMCGTGVSNLWTTCAALSRLPNLVELCFAKCVCCQGTGKCNSMVSCEANTNWFLKNFNVSGRTTMHEWGSPNTDDYDTQDSLRSEFSQSEEEEEQPSSDLFSDDDSAPPHANTESGGSSLDSHMDFLREINVDQTMDVDREDDIHYHGDVEFECSIDPATSSVTHSAGQSIAILEDTVVGADEYLTQNRVISEQEDNHFAEHDARRLRVGMLEEVIPFEPELGDSEEEEVLINSLGHSNSFENFISDRFDRAGPSTRDGHRVHSERGGSSGDERLELFSTQTPKEVDALSLGGAHHAAPICSQKHYREFMITTLSGLKVLDNIFISEVDRERAWKVYSEHFERHPNNRKINDNICKVLKRRETGGWGIAGAASEKRRLGMVVNEPTTAAARRSLCAAKVASCAWPAKTSICRLKNSNIDLHRKCRPRQFEYHPTEPGHMVFGTLHGEVVVVNHESDKVVGYVQSTGAPHSILGLCWLNKDPNKLIAGSDNGSLKLYDVNHMRTTMLSAGRSGLRAAFNSSSHSTEPRAGIENSGSRCPAIYTYDAFERLTSVHINSTDDYFLASGYSKHVGLYDLPTGKQIQIFSDLHQEHINVVKFAHHSPHVFATSSFDREIKMWDIRTSTQPFYTVHSNRGNVMVCFSRDDHYLLSSAVDNEVRQYLAVDGRLHIKFDIEPLGKHQNYTRSYYMNGRDYIITGSCEENVVRIFCSQTGRHLRDLSLEGPGMKRSLYVQSLRGDPFRDFHFCVLVAYNMPHSRSEIVKVNMLASDLKGRNLEAVSQSVSLTAMGA